MKLNKSFDIYAPFSPMQMKRFLMASAGVLLVHVTYAKGYETADYMRSIGKIYVVAGVCWIILLTLLVYLVLLDRKISRIEKRQKNE